MANYLYMVSGGGGGSGGGPQERFLAQAEDVVFSSTGNTPIYTVPTDRQVIVTKVFVFIDDATGLTGTMAAGLGFNGAADNIILSAPFTNFDDSLNALYIMLAQNLSAATDSGDTISFGIDTAFGGTVTGSVVLFGIEVGD